MCRARCRQQRLPPTASILILLSIPEMLMLRAFRWSKLSRRLSEPGRAAPHACEGKSHRGGT